MPRLSLYRPEKGNDYKFIDRQASEMFTAGGTDLYIHKYLGPKNPDPEDATADQPYYSNGIKETNIQDLLFLENRDRTYESSIYRIRGVYNVADIDFNLSQFGLFIDNDTVFMTVHINDFIRTIGRKPLSGDVVEIPHLKDEFALNEYDVSLPRYYVISDVGRAAEGFSPTWYPHLYRLKLTKIADSQQYKDIFDKPVSDDSDLTLREILSTQNKALEINDSLIAQAEADAAKSGYETQHLYTLAVDLNGNASLETAAAIDVDASNDGGGLTASTIFASPKRPGYQGYLLGDGVPENGAAFGHGISFPQGPVEGDYFLRTDFLPNRLFRYDGARWIKREDNVRTSMTPSATRNTQKGTFINNDRRTGIDQVGSDFVIATNGNTIQTTIDYVEGMYAEGAPENAPFRGTLQVNNVGGKAQLVFADNFTPGIRVEWRLYLKSEDQRQPLSKALRPKADF